MKTFKRKIIKIGNGRGIRLPKSVLEKAGIVSDIEMEVVGKTIEIRPVRHPREGWEASAAEMAANGDDALLDPYIPTQFDLEEWEW